MAFLYIQHIVLLALTRALLGVQSPSVRWQMQGTGCCSVSVLNPSVPIKAVLCCAAWTEVTAHAWGKPQRDQVDSARSMNGEGLAKEGSDRCADASRSCAERVPILGLSLIRAHDQARCLENQ